MGNHPDPSIDHSWEKWFRHIRVGERPDCRRESYKNDSFGACVTFHTAETPPETKPLTVGDVEWRVGMRAEIERLGWGEVIRIDSDDRGFPVELFFNDRGRLFLCANQRVLSVNETPPVSAITCPACHMGSLHVENYRACCPYCQGVFIVEDVEGLDPPPPPQPEATIPVPTTCERCGVPFNVYNDQSALSPELCSDCHAADHNPKHAPQRHEPSQPERHPGDWSCEARPDWDEV
jgi:hypothetical protein